MAEIAIDDFAHQTTSSYKLPETVRSRLNDLRNLSGDRLEIMLGATEEVASDGFKFRPPPTAIREQMTGESLAFLAVAQTSPRITRFVVEQEFEGMVVSVDPDSDFFVARLADLTAEGPAEEAEIGCDEISPDDRALIVPGALFCWYIGRSTESNGQVRRISEIRFRRFFHFTPSTIAQAEEDAARMLELLNDG